MSFKELKVERIEGELADALSGWNSLYRLGFVKIGQKKWLVPYRYAQEGDDIHSFEIRPDDTWVISYPRSGTTMTQELVWLVANDMNFDEANRRHLIERFPFIEMEIMLGDIKAPKHIDPDKINPEKNSIKFVRDQPSPRFIKSHLPFELLPTVVNSTCKIIYVARNPRDVAVSLYNIQKTIKNLINFQETFEQFCNTFMNNNMPMSPYWEHLKEAWAMRHRANIMFLFYEDLMKDLPSSIKKIAAFFNKTYSDEQIAQLVEHLKVENFSKNPMVTHSRIMMQPDKFPQGITDDSQKVFTPEIEKKFSKWTTDNLKDTDLVFPN